MASDQANRGSWGTGIGFVLAAAGSAVGLGNIWRFPYITAENGGGAFVLLYLACIALVGLPIMIAEILIGRATQASTVSAFRALTGKRSPWMSIGWAGVACAYLILSFYAVVAGWALHYVVRAVSGSIAGQTATQLQDSFAALNADAGLNIFWMVVFMALTMAMVLGGVRGGLERWSRILMPLLLAMLVGMLVYAFTLSGFGEGISFIFGFHTDQLTAGGILEALGHSFFTLSLGMGAMLTYGSYLSKQSDLVGNSLAITVLDTVIALLACMVLLPITMTAGLEAAQGPGLVFISMPIAFAQLPGGSILATVFFSLLVFAALTSSISMLEVAAAYFIDDRGWSRHKATLVSGLAITVLGIPSALTGATVFFGEGMGERFFGSWLAARLGNDWFSIISNFSSNILLPVGGLGIALFVAWRMGERLRHDEFLRGGKFAAFYSIWLAVLRFFVPLAILAVFLHVFGVV
jgi:NSS family neurotransmitter:Na+ symporter